MAREMSLSFKDWRGNDITIGTRVIYPAEYKWHKSLVEAEVVKIVARSKYDWKTKTTKVAYSVGVKPINESADRERCHWACPVTIHHWWNLMALPEEKSEPASQTVQPITNSTLRSPFMGPSNFIR